MRKKSPYLSIVVTSRNDNHGGSLQKRMQLFISSLLTQAKKYGVNGELIIVEWNPPKDALSIAEAFTWQRDVSFPVRIITVPPEIHAKFHHSDKLPLFQMIAKNVGIRRAYGAYVLATNIDIIFPNDLMKQIAQEKFRPGLVYRAYRIDSLWNVPEEVEVDMLLTYCRSHIIRINMRFGTISNPLFLLMGKYLNIGHLERILFPFANKPLFTNACGDFTLMAKSHWDELSGYAEYEMFSFHLDGLLLRAADALGLKENVLGSGIFHLEHEIGSGYSPGKGWNRLKKRMKDIGVPVLDKPMYWRIVEKMKHDRKNIPLNKYDWGMAKQRFPEIIIRDGQIQKL